MVYEHVQKAFYEYSMSLSSFPLSFSFSASTIHDLTVGTFYPCKKLITAILFPSSLTQKNEFVLFCVLFRSASCISQNFARDFTENKTFRVFVCVIYFYSG